MLLVVPAAWPHLVGYGDVVLPAVRCGEDAVALWVKAPPQVVLGSSGRQQVSQYEQQAKRAIEMGCLKWQI